jgi:hypothetical protein
MSEREQSTPATAADRPGGAGATAYGTSPATDPTLPRYSAEPMAAKRPDPAAALLLLVAGLLTGVSLLLPWLADDDVTGLTLVKDASTALGNGVAELLDTGYVQPLTIVLGGGALFLLGLLLLVPARRHRLVGLVALVVALLVTAAVLVPLAIAGWDLGAFGVGFWFAIAVAVLGLLGALKALVTRPRFSAEASGA